MKTSRFGELQILTILRQAKGGVPVPELCREHGMSTAFFYKWCSKYRGMDASMISQMKALEDANRRLKMYAELRSRCINPVNATRTIFLERDQVPCKKHMKVLRNCWSADW